MVEQVIPVEMEPADYEPMAVIYIPRLGSDWQRVIRQTVDVERVLNSYDAGVGHYPGTAMPGDVGNFAIAGHDSGWGNTFIDLSRMRLGDRVYVRTASGWYTYVFRNFKYVQPDAVNVLAPVPADELGTAVDRIMTITTCNPPFNAGERLIAFSTLEVFSPPEAVPAELSHVLGEASE